MKFLKEELYDFMTFSALRIFNKLIFLKILNKNQSWNQQVKCNQNSGGRTIHLTIDLNDNPFIPAMLAEVTVAATKH